MISPEIICQQHFSDSKNLQKSEKSAIIEWLKTLCLQKFALLIGIICYALLVILIFLVVFAAQKCKYPIHYLRPLALGTFGFFLIIFGNF